MKLIFLPVIVALLITFTVTGEKLIAKYQPRIDVLKDVDVCDSTAKTRLIFVVNIGEIKKSDSLFGFDLEIKYNPEKLKIMNFLTGNTLSEFFEEKGFSLGLEGNLISGYATTFNFNLVPPSGDSILVAFSAEWLGNCQDTSYLELTELNFTEEFKKDLDTNLGGGIIKAYPFDKPARYGSLSVGTKDIKLKDNENNFDLFYNVALPTYYNTESIILEFNSKELIEIYGASTTNENVEVMGTDENKVTLRLYNRVKEFVLKLNCNYAVKDTISDYKFFTNKIIYSDCSCILGISSDTVNISKDSTFVSVADYNMNEVTFNNNVISINNTEMQIDKVVLFDVLGRIIQEEATANETEIKIFTEEIQTSIFFVGIYKGKKYEIKKFYKCYYY
jgi:hypothetical protein